MTGKSWGRKPSCSGLLFDKDQYLSPRVDEVIVYHDETKEVTNKNDWGHGLLFVPQTARASLLDDLWKAHIETDYYGELHFSEISPSVNRKKLKCTQRFIEIGVNYLERHRGCKFAVIFCDKSNLDLKNYAQHRKEREIKFMEVLLRMVLKGGLHYLYNEEWKVKLLGIVTDGKPWYREYSKDRIFEKLIKMQGVMCPLPTLCLSKRRNLITRLHSAKAMKMSSARAVKTHFCCN